MQSLIQNNTIKLNLQHNISSSKILEARYDLYQNILSVKENIEKRYGSDVNFMRLVLKDNKGKVINNMEDDLKTLNYYGAQNGHIIYVLDLNPNSIHKEIQDLASIQKYKISEEDYDKLPQNFRKWKKELMEHNPQLNHQIINNPASLDNQYMKSVAENIHIGDRCKIQNGSRGQVKFVGKIMDLGIGYFIGVLLDEPFGNSNGIIKGVKYFEASQKYAIFLRPDKLEIGDFPVLDADDQI